MTSPVIRAINPLLFAASLGAVAYAGTCLALYRYQTKLIFRPLPTLMTTPADMGIPYEDIWIPVGPAGTASQLHGWWLPNLQGSRKGANTLLFCHGNYGNISYNLERIRFHYNLGFSVLAFDYRGYGLSSGPEPTEQTTYEDAAAAWQYLTHTRQIAPEKITLMGHSMGGAIAIHLATQQPQISRLIVKSSFTTLQDVIESRGFYRFFPVAQLLAHPFNSLSKVSQLKVPVLYVHGDQDPDIPADMSQRLYNASPEPKQLWIATGADHNNISRALGDTYGEVVNAFCQNVPAVTAMTAVTAVTLAAALSAQV
jgi:uncharacterized protein